MNNEMLFSGGLVSGKHNFKKVKPITPEQQLQDMIELALKPIDVDKAKAKHQDKFKFIKDSTISAKTVEDYQKILDIHVDDEVSADFVEKLKVNFEKAKRECGMHQNVNTTDANYQFVERTPEAEEALAKELSKNSRLEYKKEDDIEYCNNEIFNEYFASLDEIDEDFENLKDIISRNSKEFKKFLLEILLN